MSELPTTREALIWKIANAIALGEGRSLVESPGSRTRADREFITALFRDVIALVDKAEVSSGGLNVRMIPAPEYDPHS